KRIEDMRRETESTLNRLRTLFSPLLQAVFSQPGGSHTLDVGDLIQKRQMLLVNLRETPFFTHDQKQALGGLFIQEIIAAMQITPREMRVPHPLVIEECGELMGEELFRAAGACRKFGTRLVLCGQDLSTLATREHEMAAKFISQLDNLICFNSK